MERGMEGRSYVLKTLGCKANLYDSQLIEAELQRRGWTAWGGAAAPDLCIVNSCTVTDEADRQSRRLASRLARENPRARVVVTGCGAEVDPERLARSRGIHYVVGNQDKPRLVELILAKLESQGEARPVADATGEVLGGALEYGELRSRHPMDREWPLPAESFAVAPALGAGETSRTRAFLKIQEGCNSFCTYCVIPYGRGPSRSLAPEQVVAHARRLVEQGAREIVVTGTNIGDYGVDWGLEPAAGLAGLFERILGETRLERLRVGSLDPSEISPRLLELARQDARFCPHFHVSLQSLTPRILKLMKRKYTLERVRETLGAIAELPAPAGGPFAGMDLITGFPGETDEDFEQAREELARLPWSRLHVFPYSEREGTPATRLPGRVRQDARVARARRLGELSLARVQAQAELAVRAGELGPVLFEKPMTSFSAEGVAPLPAGMLWASGYTSNYLRALVALPAARARGLRNQLAQVRPLRAVADRASGEAAIVCEPELLRTSE